MKLLTIPEHNNAHSRYLVLLRITEKA